MYAVTRSKMKQEVWGRDFATWGVVRRSANLLLDIDPERSASGMGADFSRRGTDNMDARRSGAVDDQRQSLSCRFEGADIATTDQRRGELHSGQVRIAPGSAISPIDKRHTA